MSTQNTRIRPGSNPAREALFWMYYPHPADDCGCTCWRHLPEREARSQPGNPSRKDESARAAVAPRPQVTAKVKEQ